ncbi:MAG: enolase C-terminal domain-like protein [Dehalococcoidia bacterium]
MSAGRPARLLVVRWRPFRLPLQHRFEAAHGALADRLGVLIELHSSDGLIGIGEASPMPSLGDGTVEDVLAMLEAHAGAIVRTPDDVLAALMGGAGVVPPILGGGSGRAGDAGIGPGTAALACGLDTALLDLEGQRRGVPVARLLADRVGRSVLVNAVVGSGDIEATVRFAAEAVTSGYGVLKFKVGAGDLDADVARIEAVRRANPAVRIRLDANGAWTEAQAVAALEAFAPLDVELIEQPVRAPAVRALGNLRRKRLTRVAADEALSVPGVVEAIVDQGAADYLVLKPMRLGGIRRSLDLAQLGVAASIPSFVTTTFDSSIGTAAALQLAAALGAGRPADGLSTADHLAADLVTRPLRPRHGRLRLPSRPGLGVTVSTAALERLATGPWREARAGRR